MNSQLSPPMTGSDARNQNGVEFGEVRKDRYTALTAVSLYLLFWLIVFCSTMFLPSLQDPMCFGLLKDKHRILRETKSPKIVFLGGSNLLFGLDGPRLAKELRRPVVNMGLCLMFPLSYLFDEVKDDIHAGDLVVLSPEYADFSSEYANNIAVADILDVYPEAFYWIVRSNCLQGDQLLTLIGHARALGLDKLDYAIHHLRQIVEHRCRWSHGDYNQGLDVMNSSNIDECGDLTWHLKQKNDNTPSPILFVVSSYLGSAEAQAIDAFGDYCASRKAKFVMIPPSVSKSQYQTQKSKVETLIASCRHQLKVPIISQPERYTFPVKMIFSQQYHLNRVGRAERAKRLIADLKPVVDEVDLISTSK